MKLSYNWLKDYLVCDLSAQQIADAMTSIGIEVDGVEEQEQIPGGLAGVVVAKVVECGNHPDSDHLHITKVDNGSGELLTVVCGAPNVAAGQKVLFAQIGSVLPGDFKIKKSKIRGVESFGMICAEDELGIGTSHDGIMVLPEDAVIGTSAKEYLKLGTEAVIEYEITANRVDAASHWGVARDLYAYLRLNGIPCELRNPVDACPELPMASGEAGLKIDVQDFGGAPRYTGVTIKGVKVGPSPEWLQNRLNAIGSRPINNIVDISNFVLFELGQPLHTFDAAKVSGGCVIVRRAGEGELIKTLDGVDHKLAASDMVIANADGPMCIAGVFGGEDSGVTESTVDLFIESAYFDPASIRKTSKSQGLQTDASFRYERGADPSITLAALRRAVALVLECAGGEIAGGAHELYPTPVEKKEIALDYNSIEEFIGKKIGHETIENILTWLGYEFKEKCDAGAVVLAPTYMVDVYRQCDVVEEILRIYGYNNIELPHHMKMSVNATPKPEPESLRNGISNFLAANGFVETMNNSLTKGDYYSGLATFPAERSVKIVNPLSQDLNVLRQTLILNGLEVVAYNINRQISSLRIFEYGSVYQRLPEKDGKTLEGYEEHTCFSMFMTGTPDKSWRDAAGKSSFFQLKGYVELLLKRFGADLYQMWTDAAPSDIFSEGVVYKLPGQGKQLAVLGTVNPALARKFGIKQPVFAAEISWPVLFDLIKRNKVAFKEMPKFPEVRRDLALLLDEKVAYADLRAAAFKSAKKLLKDVTLFDVYRGDKIPQGMKQYAMSFTIQDLDKTLTDQDTERVMERLLSVFKNDFGAQLR
ncbi:MAG: phenylalanine--tRNA ligase subunit beta [Bacteroidales bacterium]|nr:phenylalanine--tRNA ligase subunit beta [Candidatus Cryptobacteroides equifaecalis]